MLTSPTTCARYAYPGPLAALILLPPEVHITPGSIQSGFEESEEHEVLRYLLYHPSRTYPYYIYRNGGSSHPPGFRCLLIQRSRQVEETGLYHRDCESYLH